MHGTTLQAALPAATRLLAAHGIEDPAREARLLALHVLGLPPRAMPGPGMRIDQAAFDAVLARRAAREPLAFIIGECGFWTLDLWVSPATLIPRPDSETLVEAALQAQPDGARVRRILDLGTGTGCLLLACLAEFPAAFGLGIDRNPDAAALARRNAGRNGLAARAAFLAGDWDHAIAGQFDLVLCNPPYIATADIPGLMPEVAAHEPALALDGGEDGLACYRHLLPRLRDRLSPHGVAVFELGAGQAAQAMALAGAAGLSARLRADLAGIGRALILRPGPAPIA